MIIPYGPILFHDITYMAIIIMKTLKPSADNEECILQEINH